MIIILEFSNSRKTRKKVKKFQKCEHKDLYSAISGSTIQLENKINDTYDVTDLSVKYRLSQTSIWRFHHGKEILV